MFIKCPRERFFGHMAPDYINYSTYRQSFKKSFRDIVPDITNFSTHSTRSGGATSAANSGIPERNFQRHGRWASVSAKNTYIKDSLASRLDVSKPNVVADAIVDLAREIENSCDAKIVLSEITTRNDAHSNAVKTVNRRLKQFSRQNGWKLISHANITQNGLNKGGLHLNREGNDSLHRNFVNFLRNNN